jgi:competence protein ComEC
VTPYGVLANLAAMPVVSAVVMPAGLLGLLTAPFGLDGWCWSAMGWGIDWMIAVTRWVAALPGAVGRVTAFGVMPLIAMSLGLILIGLLRTPLRWSGALVLASGVVWALALPQPDVLISGDGRNVAVRGRDGALHMMRTGKDAFLFKEWLAADADARLPTDPSLGAGVSCDDLGCVAAMADGRLVALSLRSEAVADDCARAALVVTSRQAPSSCAASVIDRERLQHQGALALRRQREGQVPRQREGEREGIAFAVEAARPNGIDRPWWPGATDGGEFDATLVPRSAAPAPTPAPTAAPIPAPARWQDATPAEPDQQQED